MRLMDKDKEHSDKSLIKTCVNHIKSGGYIKVRNWCIKTVDELNYERDNLVMDGACKDRSTASGCRENSFKGEILEYPSVVYLVSAKVDYETANRGCIVCPYCGHKHIDSWEFSEGKIECVFCDGEMEMCKEMTVTYTTVKERI